MMKQIPLGKEKSAPALGLGTWKLLGDACVEGVEYALSTGYRHIDTADIYGNHKEVGQGIKNSGVPREDIFLVTKVWNTNHHHDDVIKSGERFLKELGVDYIDLLLVHWPMRDVPIDETLRAMKELQDRSIVRALGVSNFTKHHIEDALKTGVEIVNNQVEIHPHFKQKELREYCASKSISVTAYSPLGHTTVLSDPTIVGIAEKYKVSPAQVCLAWVMERDMFAIPKSAHKERIKDNFMSSSLQIDEADLVRIDAMPDVGRVNVPAFNEFDY